MAPQEPSRPADPGDGVHADFLQRLRRFHEGVLSFGELVEPVRFVLDPVSGEPVLPIPTHVLDHDSVMLYLPDDGIDNPDCLQLHAQPQAIDPEREEAADRFTAYFGKALRPRWARLRALSLKRLDEVIDGELVRLANPLRPAEGRLCRLANARADAVTAWCKRRTGTGPDQAMVVGVDPWGADVRARFGVIRVEFDQPVGTEDEARAVLERELGASS